MATPQWNFLDLITSQFGLLTRRSQLDGLESFELQAKGWFYGACVRAQKGGPRPAGPRARGQGSGQAAGRAGTATLYPDRS